MEHQALLHPVVRVAPDTHRGSRSSSTPVWRCPLALGREALALLITCVFSHSLAANLSIATPGRRLDAGAAEVLLGERLFFETRFAEYFYSHSDGNVNVPLEHGDPLVHDVERPGAQPLVGPFRGGAINCRHCHLGDDFNQSEPLAQRTYADFVARSSIPERNDGLALTVRNSSQMVDLGLSREVPQLFHYDGEFAAAEDLIVATLTGRNMGWRHDEAAVAISHIARVIREDEGVNPRRVQTADGVGVPYRIALLGTRRSESFLRIPPDYRLDVNVASDQDVLSAIARLIRAYMDSIRFGTQDTQRETDSPYDLFLRKNGLPTGPDNGESNLTYARRLLRLIENQTGFTWVIAIRDGEFGLHAQAYQFMESELRGLRIFLTESANSKSRGAGNCIACHTPPQFTDHKFHNTGASQAEYDALFGSGAFAALEVPNLRRRNALHDAYLPATVQHPNALGRFRAIPTKERPGYADLGAWNIFANADFPKPQQALASVLCGSASPLSCMPPNLLPKTIAVFKTPSIRDLGHSQPYFHNGAAQTLEEVVRSYRTAANLARIGKLRNGDKELKSIRLDDKDSRDLAQFLRALNEDYH